jgi:Asp-tRNA(Asn)/Glu-tRNA(Gln) amidotransferase C subunit
MSSTTSAIPASDLQEILRLARIALTAEEFDEFIGQITTAEQAGQEAAA